MQAFFLTGCRWCKVRDSHLSVFHRRAETVTSTTETDQTAAEAPLRHLRVAVVGAGPSGLLLAHRLLLAGASVDIFESRPDPRADDAALEGRAYALGLGIRGRTAIRTAGDELWARITPRGYGSERFKVYLSSSFALDLRTPEDGNGLEPSLLIYQSDLCGAMLDELDAKYGASGRLKKFFKTRVADLDPKAGTLLVQKVQFNPETKEVEPQPGDDGQQRAWDAVDVIAGCDGVNSVVREAIAKSCAGFDEEITRLPGFLKVVRFEKMPSALDPTAVCLVPGGSGTAAFLEPTARGACALINWRGQDNKIDEGSAASLSGSKEGDAQDLAAMTDALEVKDELMKRLPMLADAIDLDAGEQFVKQGPSRAATVKCNTYHYGCTVLLGDAAHSTGGASGQGCNSALQDAAELADILLKSGQDVDSALLTYSKQRVPEGHALLDLSVGPSVAAGPLRKALYGMASLRDTLLSRFKICEPPLQTQLTTTLTPFAEIRRKRDFFFGDFPSTEAFNSQILELTSAGRS